MKQSLLKELFENKVDLTSFKHTIDEEVRVYKQKLEEKGRSTIIHVVEDIANFDIKNEDLILLANFYLSGSLNTWELNYIGEAISLSENIYYANDAVQNAVEALSDPEFYKLISPNFITKIVGDLSQTGPR